MATKQIYAAPEQYGIDTFIQKFPGGYDTILSALTVLAFEDYVKDLWDNNWSINTPNPNNWSLHNTIETYRKVLSEFSGDPQHPLSLDYDVQQNFTSHLFMVTEDNYVYSIWYHPNPNSIGYPRSRAEAISTTGLIEITNAQMKLPFFFGGQDFSRAYLATPLNPMYFRTQNDIKNPYITDIFKALIAADILLDLLPPEISTNIGLSRFAYGTNKAIYTSLGTPSATVWNFRDSDLAKTLRNIRPMVRDMAIKRFQGAYFNIKTKEQYMNFKEQYIAPDQLTNPNLPSDTIYYSIAKDAPLTGLKNPDGSDTIINNAQLQYTVGFWSKIFSDAGFLPLLQGIAATYPTQITSQYDTKSQAAYNSVVSNITRKHSFFTETILIDYHFNTLLSQFNITMDSQRRIFVVFTRDALKEDINVKLTANTFWGSFLTVLIMAVVAYFAITLMVPAGPAGDAGLIGTMLPAEPIAAGSGITDFFASVGKGLSSILGPIASALPVIAPLLAIFGVTPTPKGGPTPAPVNNTCPPGYTFQNGQCIADSSGGSFQLGSIFTGTNLALMAGGGVILGLLFMGDDDNKAYRAAKRATTEGEIKTNRPKRRYNKRRQLR